jgi:uncharacterized protein
VSSVYVDTSALARVLLRQPDSLVIERELGRFDYRVSSRILGVELQRVALRTGVSGGDELLEGIAFVRLDDVVLTAAEQIEPTNVATLDAIHLATAVRLHADGELDAMLTYDARLAEGARHHGIDVRSPT